MKKINSQVLYMCLGILTGFFLLIGANFIPYTEIKPLSLVQEDAGPRLYIGKFHIHHYIFGIILLLLAIYLIIIRKYLNFAWFLLGLGVILIIDELPNLISGEMHPYLSVIFLRLIH